MDILICDDEPLAIERLSRLVSQLGTSSGGNSLTWSTSN